MFHVRSAVGASTGSAAPLWTGPHAPVVCGSGVDEVRCAADGPVHLAVVGSCGVADERILRDALRHVRSGRWAELTRWPGSYWVIADDGQHTAVLTDVAGTRPVYLARTESGALWSTSASALARHIAAGVDFAAVVTRLVCPTVAEVTRDETAYEGVRRVPGGHVLITDRTGRHTITAYEEQRRLPFEDAALELREALLEAVTYRVKTAERLTADFSGGLDSTSLALLAHAAGADLLAVTHVDEASRNEDVQYAQRAARGKKNLRHVLVTDDEGLFFAGLPEAPHTDQPFPDAARWRLRAAHQRVCIEYGSDLHLGGSGADMLLSAPRTYLADLARERDLAALLRHSRAKARLRHRPLYAVAAEAIRLSRTPYSLTLQHLAGDIAAGRPQPAGQVGWVRPSSVCAWLTPQARRHIALRAAEAAEIAEEAEVPAEEVSRHCARSELYEYGVYEAELRNQSHAMGLPHHAPFLDNQVVRAAMAVSVREHASLTVQKPLLGAALDGLVPFWLLARRTKGSYSGNACTGIRRHAAELRELITGGRLTAEGWLDGDAALRELERLAVGVPGRFAALEAVIAAELWIRQQREVTPHGAS